MKLEKTVKEIISKNIAQLRKKEGMTQAELAERLFYSDKAISKWERGDSLPDAEMLYRLAEIFHVEIQYLFTEHESIGLSHEELERLKKKEIRYKIVFSLVVVAILTTLLMIILGSTLEVLMSTKWTLTLFVIPVLLSVVLMINNICGKKRFNLVLISLIIWTLAEFLYLYFIEFEPVIIFAVATVLEVAFIIWPFLSPINFFYQRKKRKEKLK